ncbi:argonaute 2 [Dermatophagoides farinae]|uniref:Argonaute 2 n=1 Tax=Dermatophagoides farinae TaxID=6954 RepID=A0A9D4P296_DERFA|nr:argonaute 2 [Dermatophagoides farinae]
MTDNSSSSSSSMKLPTKITMSVSTTTMKIVNIDDDNNYVNKRGRFDLFATKPDMVDNGINNGCGSSATSGSGSGGQAGRSMLIQTNHFMITYDPDKIIYSYYVKINPIISNNNDHHHHYSQQRLKNMAKTIQQQQTTPNRSHNNGGGNELLSRKIIQRLIEMNNGDGNIFHNVLCVYDGASSMLTNFRLPIIDDKLIKFRVTLPANDYYHNEQEFEVCIKLIKTVAYSTIEDFYRNPMNDGYVEVVTAVNLIIRHLLLKKRFLIGRSNFHHHSSVDNRINLSSLKELSFGISSSVQTCSAGLQLIMDRCCTPFIKPFMIDDCIRNFLQEMSSNTTGSNNVNHHHNHHHHHHQQQQQQRWNDFYRKRLEPILKDYYFEVTNLQRSRRYRIGGITTESAKKVMFTPNNDNNEQQQQQRK